MRVGRKAKAERVPVSLAARVTEVGTIELWCQSRTDDRRWRLQIQLRGPAGQPPGAGDGRRRGGRPGGHRAVRARRGDRRDPRGVRGPAPRRPARRTGPARLVKRLEEVLDVPRDQWPPSALRAFWEPLRDLAEQRLKSPQHESRWFNLVGFSLRPGRGYPARRGPDQGPLAGLPPGGEAHQGRAVLGRVVDPLAAGRGRAEPPHHDEIYRRLVPFLLPAKGIEPRQESRPAQARAARAGRDVALRRQPRAAGARGRRRRWATP